MKKFSLSLLAAGAMAVAGLAQADVIFYPDGTSVELGNSSLVASDDSSIDTTVLGAGSSDLSLMSSSEMSSSVDTTTLGAGPSSTTTITTTSPMQFVYVQPNINWDRSIALKQIHSNAHLMHRNLGDKSAAATFNVPTRAGEVSTMTGGAPNAVTTNDRFIVGSYMIPYSAVSEPYYVFSY